MRRVDDPRRLPEWRALGREAALVRELIGSGVTSLRNANYANKVGLYYVALFGVSIGLERLLKLILVADYAICHEGQMPPESVIRKFGHRLADLRSVVETMVTKHGIKSRFKAPPEPVCSKIVSCLDAFADANRGRYSNFASLGNPLLSDEEPIGKWWGEVAEEILRVHYYDHNVERQAEYRARLIHHALSPVSFVRFTDEGGELMDDIYSSSVRTGRTNIVQKYGVYYTLTLARHFSEILSEMSRKASFEGGYDAFDGLWEYFWTFTVEDLYLRRRKVWPLT